jgi:hypothetical protein
MKNARLEVFLGVRVAKVVPARPDIGTPPAPRRNRPISDASGHAVGHRALLGIDHELGDRAVHARLVPAGRMPDVVGPRMDHRRQRRGALVARLRVEGLGAAQRVGGAPGHAVMARHLADHEVHEADFGRARHRRARTSSTRSRGNGRRSPGSPCGSPGCRPAPTAPRRSAARRWRARRPACSPRRARRASTAPAGCGGRRRASRPASSRPRPAASCRCSCRW